MRLILFAVALPILFVTSACSSVKKTTGVLAPTCEKTAINSSDMAAFGFTPAKDKVVVARIFTTWCPYCKEDMTELGKHFKSGEFTPETVQVLLLTYKSSRDNKSTFDKFLRETFPKFEIPPSAVQVIYLDKPSNELSKAKTLTGEPLFTGWQGIPFGLVFGNDGRLAFRGHFTTSPQFQEGHYQFIKGLTKETCPPN